MDNETLQTMHDEMQIRKLISNMCRGADRCDAELLKSIYWPDATYSHVFFEGNAHEYAKVLIPMLKEKTESTVHVIGNYTIEIDGDIACCETYISNFIRVKPNGTQNTSVIICGRLLDRAERRNGEWRISAHKVLLEWEMNGAAMFGEETIRKVMAVDRRGSDDISYRFFANKTL